MAEISVVIPCYNHARYLRDALDSVAKQTVKPARVFVVNDCSRDDSEYVAITHPLCLSGKATYCRHLQNLGLGAARNTAIADVPEDGWILCLDADDALMPNAIELLQVVIRAGAPTTNLVTFPLEDFDYPAAQVWDPSARIRLEQLESRNLFPYCAAYPKSLWSAIGGYDEGECSRLGINDWEFWQRAHRLVELKPVRISTPLVRYRQHAGPRLSDQFKGREELVRSALRRARERSQTREKDGVNSRSIPS